MAEAVKIIGNKRIRIIKNGGQLNDDAGLSQNDREMDKRAIEAVRSVINKAMVCNKPVAKYDMTTKKAYIDYGNGKKRYVE